MENSTNPQTIEARMAAHWKDVKTLGARIAARRKVQGLTQKSLGLRAHVSAQVIHNLEVGKNKNVNQQIITRLCYALKCTSDYLFGFSDNLAKCEADFIVPIRRAPELMDGYTIESRDLFNQDPELAKPMFEYSKRLPKKDMLLLKEMLVCFLKANPDKSAPKAQVEPKGDNKKQPSTI